MGLTTSRLLLKLSYLSTLIHHTHWHKYWPCVYSASELGAMETPHYGNASPRKYLKNHFWGISVLFWEIPQNWTRVRDFRIFLSCFPIFIVKVFPVALLTPERKDLSYARPKLRARRALCEVTHLVSLGCTGEATNIHRLNLSLLWKWKKKLTPCWVYMHNNTGFLLNWLWGLVC